MIYGLSMEDKKRRKKEHDFNVTAFRVVQEAIRQTEEEHPKTDIGYVVLGRKGGLNGGKSRAEKLTPEQRSEIAKKAAMVRWKTKV